jgi:hypothetical protein
MISPIAWIFLTGGIGFYAMVVARIERRKRLRAEGKLRDQEFHFQLSAGLDKADLLPPVVSTNPYREAGIDEWSPELKALSTQKLIDMAQFAVDRAVRFRLKAEKINRLINYRLVQADRSAAEVSTKRALEAFTASFVEMQRVLVQLPVTPTEAKAVLKIEGANGSIEIVAGAGGTSTSGADGGVEEPRSRFIRFK